MILRHALRSGGTAVGTWVQSCSPIMAEALAAAGFDFVTVDAEHSAVDVPQALALFQAVRAGDPRCTPLVRLPGHDYATVKRYMDAGAGGVIAPLINTAAEAGEVVAAVKYPPDGARGVGFARANVYGMRLEESLQSANEESLIAVQLEHADGVTRANEILSVPGIDAAFVGPYDLSMSLGVPGQFDHPLMRDALGHVLETCRRVGVTPGIHVIQPNVEEVFARMSEGYRLIAYSLDTTMALQTARVGLDAVRRAVSRTEA